jgi:hypothetical protein
LMDEALQDETSKEGEQVKSPYKCNTIIEHRLDISDCKESNPKIAIANFIFIYLRLSVISL